MTSLYIENNTTLKLIIHESRLVETIKKKFTYQNPSFFMLKRKNRFIDPELRWNKLYKTTNSSKELLLPRGLFTHIIEIFKKDNITLNVMFELGEIVDLKNKDKIKNTDHWKVLKENYLADFVTERYYQTDPLPNFLYRKQAINITGTGGGKTPFMIYLTRLLQDHYKTVNNILIIAPVISLITQIPKKFVEFTRDDQKDEMTRRLKMLGGGTKNAFKKLKLNDDKNILVAGYQALTKRDEEFFSQFDCVILDEAHKAPCNSIRKILDKCSNIEYAYGLTATMKDHYEGLVINGMFGDVLYEKKEGDLVEEGFLSAIDIFSIDWKYENNLAKLKMINKATYDNEMLIIKNSYEKLKIYDYIFDNYIDKKKDNTVVLFKNLDSLYFVYMYLSYNYPEYNYIPIHATQSLTKDENGYYKDPRKQDLVSFLKHKSDYFDKETLERALGFLHSTKSKNRDRELDICKNTLGNVILAIRTTIDTGVDVDNLHKAILGQDIKSEQALIQGLGRIVRPQEGKLAQYFDVCDDFTFVGSHGGFNKNVAYEHKLDRLEHYKAHQYEVKELKLNIDDM